MQSKAKDLIKQQQDLMKHDQSGFRPKTIEACTSASAILSKTTAEEAIAYKKWVLAIGQKVAEAAKEHGVAVSEPEKAVLSEVSAAFGMSDV
jgi:uroporphyrinogen-III synthase